MKTRKETALEIAARIVENVSQNMVEPIPDPEQRRAVRLYAEWIEEALPEGPEEDLKTFTALAMEGLLACPAVVGTPEEIANFSVRHAKATLAALEAEAKP